MKPVTPEGEGTVLAFDYGLRYTGVAVGELRTAMCRPLCTLEERSNAARWTAIDQLLKTWEPRHLVVGLPLDEDGNEQIATRQSRRFARTLAQRSALPLSLIDERYTSLEANQNLKNRGMPSKERKLAEHAEAAALILHSFLESRPPCSIPS